MIGLEQFDALCDIEQDVINLASEGLGTDRIARALDIKPSVVSRNTRSLLGKLEVKQGGLLRVVGLACRAGFFRKELGLRPASRSLWVPEILAVHLVAECYTQAQDARIRDVTVTEVARDRSRAHGALGTLTLPHLVRRSHELDYLPLALELAELLPPLPVTEP